MYPAARRCFAVHRARIPSLSRSFIASVAVHNSSEATLHRSTELGAAEETQNIATMDRLMKTFRESPTPCLQASELNYLTQATVQTRHTNRGFSVLLYAGSVRVRRLNVDSILPVRSKGLWSETLSKLAIIEQADRPHGPTGAALMRALEPRKMHDSYCEIVLPFASSPEMLDAYTNASGGIRTGLLMEHLDSLAGSIAYKHVLGPDISALPPDAGFYIVTASVERYVLKSAVATGFPSPHTVLRLDMLASLYPVRDMRLSGQVIHTGKSSMEVAVRMQALGKDGMEQTIMLGKHPYLI